MNNKAEFKIKNELQYYTVRIALEKLANDGKISIEQSKKLLVEYAKKFDVLPYAV